MTRAADRNAFTGPVKRRLELSTKVELVRRAPPSVACYLIVLLERGTIHRLGAGFFSPPPALLLNPSAAAPLYGLSSCFVIGISLPLYLSSNISLHHAPDSLLSFFPASIRALFIARSTNRRTCL